MQDNIIYNASLNQGLGKVPDPRDTLSQKLTPEDMELYEELQTLSSILGHVSKNRVKTVLGRNGINLEDLAYCSRDHPDPSKAVHHTGEGPSPRNTEAIPKDLLSKVDAKARYCDYHMAEIHLRVLGYDIDNMDFFVISKEDEISDVGNLAQRLQALDADFTVVEYEYMDPKGNELKVTRYAAVSNVKGKYITPESKQTALETIKDLVSGESYEIPLPFGPSQGLLQLVERISDYRIVSGEQGYKVISKNKFYDNLEVQQKVINALKIANNFILNNYGGQINPEDLEGLVNVLAENTTPQVTQSVVEETTSQVPQPVVEDIMSTQPLVVEGTATLLATPIRDNIYEIPYVLENATHGENINFILREFKSGFEIVPTEQGESVTLRFHNPSVTQQELSDALHNLQIIDHYNKLIRRDSSKMGEAYAVFSDLFGKLQQ